MKKLNQIAKTTIIDIAKASGVSVSTVSRILNDKPDVAKETRERVLNIIKDYHFAPQAPWQQLKSGKSHFITLHYPKNPSRIHMINSFVIGAATACEQNNYSLNLVVSPLDEVSLLTFFRSGQTDGMILMEILLQDWRVKLLRQNNFPFVILGRCEDNSGFSYVDLDVETGVKIAMDHLIGLGHRRIGFLSAEPYLFSGEKDVNRLGYTAWAIKGYKQVCEQYDLPVISKHVQMAKESIEDGVMQLLAKRSAVTAIITVQETVVSGIIKAVQRKGLVIPDDISIVGSADGEVAELTAPPLTTVNYPAEASGFQAAKLLIEQLEGQQDEKKQFLIPFELIVRGSTSTAPLK
ncbi:MAG: LacI family DNA-binding transcriptional regulator [Anaerolineaceae bacterium]|nr:LacI family DNA-binding transcriptional regulator [Anaerolineaceae bacterium]